ncbi:MAG: hypothetical protein ABJE66_24765 [Deltaproteobacteria bacterium]
MCDRVRVELAAHAPGTLVALDRSDERGDRSSTSRYARVYERAAQLEQRFDRLAGGTAPVVRAIEHAVTSRRPRSRYVAPRAFALMIAVVRILPTCWVDRLMQRMFGLTRTQLAIDRR